MSAAKSNGNASAYPRGIWDGLTKRELFAAMAMQGILASTGNYETIPNRNKVAGASAHFADALLAELAKDGES